MNNSLLTIVVLMFGLEEILARMESTEIRLGEALELFEEGVSHVKTAGEVLAAAELRVEELLADGQVISFEDKVE